MAVGVGGRNDRKAEAMNVKPTGGAAFPTAEGCTWGNDGMTRRQWLAGLAMQGMLASDIAGQHGLGDIARWAWGQADSMLAAEDDACPEK